MTKELSERVSWRSGDWKQSLNRLIVQSLNVLCVLCASVVNSCASTTIFEAGLPVLKTQADMTNVMFQTGQGTVFHADTVDHSGPTLAGGQAITQVVGGVTSAIAVTGTAIAASGILSRAPVAAVVVPASVAALTHVSNSQTANERAALNAPPEVRAKMLKRIERVNERKSGRLPDE